MKKWVALLLVVVAVICIGCSVDPPDEEEMSFSGLNDAKLLSYVENTVYDQVIEDLSEEGEYFVENVQTVYISKEYIEELAYNTQSNVYFGLTLADLENAFEGKKFVFTLGEDNQTTVKEFVPYDDSYDKMIRNVAIGAGVILVCVTVSIVTYGSAAAVSAIFAASAKTATTFALSGAAFSGLTVGAVKGATTGDWESALKEAGVAASEGFAVGAITGALSGGLSAASALKGATCNGLTMNEAAQIQRESKLPLEFIKNFHSVDEYNVLKSSGLELTKVNGKNALIQNIDWDFIGDVSDGRTNAQRVMDGLSPLDPVGKPYELHHVGQQSDSPLAILTSMQHDANYSILHANTGSSASNIDRNLFAKERKAFWQALLHMAQGG